MATHGSATVRETPHANQTTRTHTIINAPKHRARAVLNDRTIRDVHAASVDIASLNTEAIVSAFTISVNPSVQSRT